MKRFITLCMALLLACSLFSCGKDGQSDPADIGDSSATEPVTTEITESTPAETEPVETAKPLVTFSENSKSLLDLTWEASSSIPSGLEIRKNENANGAPLSLGLGILEGVTGLMMQPDDGADGRVAAEYILPELYQSVSVLAGIDDSASDDASAEFVLYCDGYVMARSGMLNKGQFICLSAEIYGAETLTLEVINCDGSNAGDYAVWAYPTLFYETGSLHFDMEFLPEAAEYIDEMTWSDIKMIDTIEEPYRNQNDAAGLLSIGGGIMLPDHALWMHPNFGNNEKQHCAEITLDIAGKGYTTFHAMFGLEDGYLGALNGVSGVLNEDMRSVTFVFLVDGVEVSRYDVVNSCKVCFADVDVSGASTLTIKLTNYNGVHTCDASAISGGFTK